jgi:hypothetical protein
LQKDSGETRRPNLGGIDPRFGKQILVYVADIGDTSLTRQPDWVDFLYFPGIHVNIFPTDLYSERRPCRGNVGLFYNVKSERALAIRVRLYPGFRRLREFNSNDS